MRLPRYPWKISNGKVSKMILLMTNFQRCFEVKVFANIPWCQAALPLLRASRGRIVMVSSGAGAHPYAQKGAYCSSKAALNMFAGVLAAEEPQVGVFAVRPGVVDTEMWAKWNGGAGSKSDITLLDPSQPASALAKIALAGPLEWSGKFVSWDDEWIEKLYVK